MNDSRERRGPPPRKRFGQHFLEPAWAAKVIKAIAPRRDDVFLEVGPGRGALTRPLAAAAGHVVAVEIDRDLTAQLKTLDLPRVTVVGADILTVTGPQLQDWFKPSRRLDRPSAIRVAGNLPYNVASPILFRLCALHAAGLPLHDATLMLQREVADRLVAAPGSRDYGTLTVLIGLVARVDRLLELPPGAFRPPPKVRSTLVQLRFHEPEPRPADAAVFAAIVQDVFTRRRKMLANALLAHEGLTPEAVAKALDAAGIDGQRRPETLRLAEFVRLADNLSARD